MAQQRARGGLWMDTGVKFDKLPERFGVGAVESFASAHLLGRRPACLEVPTWAGSLGKGEGVDDDDDNNKNNT